MTRIHSGALLTRLPGPKYAAALTFAEVELPSPMPTARTLRRWQELAAGKVTLGLVVPDVATASAKGPLRFDAAMEAALARTQEAAAILGARFVVLATKSDVTTGPRDRDLLAQWMGRWGGTEHTLVWQPSGLWDAELARPFARKLGVLHAFDPLQTRAPLGGTTLYARLRAIGTRKRFTETLLLEVVDSLASSDAVDAFVALDSPKSFAEAQRLAALAALEE
jgi:hypothetical protein